MKSSRAVRVIAAAVVGVLVASAAAAQQAGAQDQWPPPGVHIPGQEGVTPPRLIWEYYPTFDAGRGSLPPDVAEQFDWESGRQWLFTTTFGAHLIRVSARLSYPRGMSASDKEDQTRQAGAEFAAMLQRFSVTMR